MRSLYLVLLLSTAALLWAAYAIARTVRRQGRSKKEATLSLRPSVETRDPGNDTDQPDEN